MNDNANNEQIIPTTPKLPLKNNTFLNFLGFFIESCHFIMKKKIFNFY